MLALSGLDKVPSVMNLAQVQRMIGGQVFFFFGTPWTGIHVLTGA